LINAASATQFWIDFGALTGHRDRCDGHPVRPVRGTRLPLAIAQRLERADRSSWERFYPILAQVEGKRATRGSFSQHPARLYHASPRRPTKMRRRLISPLNVASKRVTPLAPRAPDVTHRVILAGAMAPYAWSLNGEYWPNVTH